MTPADDQTTPPGPYPDAITTPRSWSFDIDDVETVPPDGLVALTPLLQAFSRGTKRSRLRTMVVVCPAGHALLEVYPTSAAGPVAIWKTRERWVQDEQGAPQRRPTRARRWEAECLDTVSPQHLNRASVVCRCSHTEAVDLEWVIEQMLLGARRVVAPAD